MRKIVKVKREIYTLTKMDIYNLAHNGIIKQDFEVTDNTNVHTTVGGGQTYFMINGKVLIDICRGFNSKPTINFHKSDGISKETWELYSNLLIEIGEINKDSIKNNDYEQSFKAYLKTINKNKFGYYEGKNCEIMLEEEM